MRRSAELASLSREHHQALEAALRLRRATDGTVEAAAEHFLAFWGRHGEHHFVIEERLLLPALPDDDAEWAAMTARVHAEHAEIRARASAISRAPSVEDSRQLGELLAAHVRYEERSVFPLVEERLPQDALRALGRALEGAEAEA